MTEFHDYARRIEEQLRLSSHPLAVKMLKTEDDIPPEAKRPTVDYGKCLAACQCFALSRKYGETVAQLFEDNWCPEPVIGFGLAEPPQFFFDGRNRYPSGVASLEAGANWAREFPRLEVGKYIGLVSAPLKTANFDPDMAVIYCNSAQVYAVVPTLLKNECQVAVPCRGDRGRAGSQDDEVIFSVPRDQIGRLAFGLEQEGTGRLPTGFSMTPEYELSESYAEMARQMGMKKANGSEIKGYKVEERRRALQYR